MNALGYVHHPKEGKYMTVKDLKELVAKLEMIQMPDSAFVCTGATGWSGQLRHIEVKAKH